MKEMLTLLVVGLCLFLPACVPSLNPLYTNKDLVHDPALVGVWGKDGEKESWSFEKGDEKSYKLTHIDDDGHKAQFEVHLVKLKQHLFLDFFPTEIINEETRLNALATMTLIPGDLFAKVHEIGPELKIAFMDPDRIKDLLTKKPRIVRHQIVKDNLGLTGSTKELQKFMIKYANFKGLFGDPNGEGGLKLKEAKPGAVGPAKTP